MATMVIDTKAGSVELVTRTNSAVSREDLKLNLQSAQSFLSEVQAKVEQMSLNSEQDKDDWDETFRTFETRIPMLNSEIKKVVKGGLSRIKAQKKPEETWKTLEEIYYTLDCTVKNLSRTCS